jgi:hypothetical protein
MSDNKKGDPPILICMPYSMRHSAKGAQITKALCCICQGEVFYNTATGLPRDVHNLSPICGACAVDLIDADEAQGEKHQFALTHPQEVGKGLVNKEVIAMIKRMGIDNVSKMALEHIRRHKAQYDASPSRRFDVN